MSLQIKMNTFCSLISVALIIASLYWLGISISEPDQLIDNTVEVRSYTGIALGCTLLFVSLLNAAKLKSNLITITILTFHFLFSAGFFFVGLLPMHWPYPVKDPLYTLELTAICMPLGFLVFTFGLAIGERWKVKTLFSSQFTQRLAWEKIETPLTFLALLGILQLCLESFLDLGNLNKLHAGANIAWIFSILNTGTIFAFCILYFMRKLFFLKRIKIAKSELIIVAFVIMFILARLITGSRSIIVTLAFYALYIAASELDYKSFTLRIKTVASFLVLCMLSVFLFPVATVLRNLNKDGMNFEILSKAISYGIDATDQALIEQIKPIIFRLSNFGYVATSVGAFIGEQIPVKHEYLGFINLIYTTINQIIPTDPFPAIPTMLTPRYALGMRPMSEYGIEYLSEPYTFVGISAIYLGNAWPLLVILVGIFYGFIWKYSNKIDGFLSLYLKFFVCHSITQFLNSTGFDVVCVRIVTESFVVLFLALFARDRSNVSFHEISRNSFSPGSDFNRGG